MRKRKKKREEKLKEKCTAFKGVVVISSLIFPFFVSPPGGCVHCESSWPWEAGEGEDSSWQPRHRLGLVPGQDRGGGRKAKEEVGVETLWTPLRITYPHSHTQRSAICQRQLMIIITNYLWHVDHNSLITWIELLQWEKHVYCDSFHIWTELIIRETCLSW